MKRQRRGRDGFQFFGSLTIDGVSQRLRVSLHELSGPELYGVELDPEGVREP
jgi:hypothetical protein